MQEKQFQRFKRIADAFSVGTDLRKFVRRSVSRKGSLFYLDLPGTERILLTASPDGVRDMVQAPPLALKSARDHPGAPLMREVFFRGGRSIVGDSLCSLEMESRGLWLQGQGETAPLVEEDIARWNGKVPLVRSVNRLSMKLVVNGVFGSLSPERRQLYALYCTRMMQSCSPLLLMFPFLRRNFGGTGPWATFQRNKKKTEQLLAEDIGIRRRSQESSEDIFGLLTGASGNGSDKTPEVLRSELMGILLSGYGSLAGALSWVLWLIAKDQSVQARLHNEISACDVRHRQETLNKLPFLDAVCRESLRLNPLEPLVLRSVEAEFSLHGRDIAPGSLIGVATQALHTDPANWRSPELFRPERFLGKSYSPFQYLPFGFGKGSDSGRVSLAEMKSVISSLVAVFHMSVDEGRSFTDLRPSSKQMVYFHRRHPGDPRDWYQ